MFYPIMPITSSTRALIEGRSSRCAQVFSPGFVFDCEFQIVRPKKLSSTLCGTAQVINLQKANSDASMKWKMSSPLLFFVSQIRGAQRMGRARFQMSAKAKTAYSHYRTFKSKGRNGNYLVRMRVCMHCAKLPSW